MDSTAGSSSLIAKCSGKNLNLEHSKESKKQGNLFGKYDTTMRSLSPQKVTVDWRVANVTPIYKKGRKEEPGNYRPLSLTSVPGKVMEQVISGAIKSHIMDNQGIRPSQHGFMKGRSCFQT